MTRLTCTLVIFLAAVLMPMSIRAEGIEPSISRADLQQMYVDYLKLEGYVPSVDEDGDVTFRFEGGFYYIDVDETDLEYFRLVFPGFWPIESPLEGRQALVALDHANRATKNTKIIKVEDNIAGVAECFLSQPEDFERIFSRSLSALKYGVEQFREKMIELTTAAATPVASQ